MVIHKANQNTVSANRTNRRLSFTTFLLNSLVSRVKRGARMAIRTAAAAEARQPDLMLSFAGGFRGSGADPIGEVDELVGFRGRAKGGAKQDFLPGQRKTKTWETASNGNGGVGPARLGGRRQVFSFAELRNTM